MNKGQAAEAIGGKGLWGAVAVVAAGVVVAAYVTLNRPADPVTPAEGQPAEAPAVATEQASARPEQPPVAGADPAAEAAGKIETPQETAPEPPQIDEVRLETDGLAVIAGRAEPGSAVSVMLDGVETAQVTADGRGDFAAIASLPESTGARVLTLKQKGAGGETSSTEEVILAPVTRVPEVAATSDAAATGAEGAPGAPAETTDSTAAEPVTVASAEPGSAEPSATGPLPEDPAATASAGVEVAAQAPAAPEPSLPGVTTAATGADTAERPAAAEPAEPSALAAAAPSVAPAQPEPQGAVTLLRSTEAGIEALQSVPETLPNVALDTIGYSSEGAVQLSGRAQTETTRVRVYLDNAAVATLNVDESGRWRGELPDVESGIYTLRVDALAADGAVTSRVETPFKREPTEVLAAAALGQEGPVRAVTVQTGDTLWAIARDRYGEGVLYVRVFDANRTSIRNPDLIYPGQVFDLPD